MIISNVKQRTNSNKVLIDIIISYLKKFDMKSSNVNREGLKSMLQIINFNPMIENVAQNELDHALLNSLSLTSRKIYFDLVQEEARDLFRNLEIEKFTNQYKNNFLQVPLLFWREFINGKRSEEDLIEDIPRILESRQDQYSIEPYFDRTWKPYIVILFAVTREAKRVKLDMFDMLYMFAHSDSIETLDGVPLLISTEEKLWAYEACRNLAATSTILMRRYRLWLERDSRRKLTQTVLFMTQNQSLVRLYHDLIVERRRSSGRRMLESVGTSLQTSVKDPNRWSDHFEETVQLLFQYGKNLIMTDCDHLESASFQSVYNTLQKLSSPTGTLEKSQFALEAFQILKRMSEGHNQNPTPNTVIKSGSFKGRIEALLEFQTNTKLLFAQVNRSPEKKVEDEKKKNYYLNKIKSFESSEMLDLIEKLFNPEIKLTRDQTYEMMDQIKLLASTSDDPIIIKDKFETWMFTHSNWRHIFLLNLIAEKALKDQEFPDLWLINHLIQDLDDLRQIQITLTDVNQLAEISIKAILENIDHDSLPTLKKFQHLKHLD
ncbi:hypothetical protein CROQUDRAFT_273557 [Cronartium quercuum f. sp. fusiforme G11]|uniref:Uncharacterized protein n=1 Tax=Cronartium quercuum f. sp. fusiforme G11 TaxID=708437 RepID=A0A9P6NSY4_9BASI|nr:hypothetical protein CROQUDRAFT_273557 [Cronartium quercuum f. sp. fusiforme G11]